MARAARCGNLRRGARRRTSPGEREARRLAPERVARQIRWVRARLKSLRSDQIPDLSRYVPPDPESFAVPLVLEVGPLGLRGRERFDLLVVTPRWLQERHGKGGAILGRGLLVVFEWRYERVRAFLARKVEACSGTTWLDVVQKVGRIAEWEGGEENVVGIR